VSEKATMAKVELTGTAHSLRIKTATQESKILI
jgi:hypothetical protein